METKPITEEDKAFTRMVDKESTDIINSMLMPVKFFYIDADFLYDFRLGALLLMSKTEEQYNYIISKLEEYECSPTMKITNIFKDLGYTEEDVNLMEHDLQYEKYVVAGAPRTKLLDEFKSVVAAIGTYNRTQTDDPGFTIIVNFRNHDIPESQWHELRGFLSAGSRMIHVAKTRYETWEEFPPDLFDKLDMILAYNMPDFVNSEMLAKSVKRFTTQKKAVMTYPQIENDRDTPEEEKDALDNFSALMGVMFYKFSYIKREISKGR